MCMDINEQFCAEFVSLNPEADPISLIYDPGVNRFVNADFGHVVHDIYRILTPGQIMLFKQQAEYMVFRDVTGSCLVELIYPDDCYLDKI